MANKVLFIFQAIDRYSGVGAKIARAQKGLNTTIGMGVGQLKAYTRQMDFSSKKVREFGRNVSDLGTELTAKLTLPLIGLGTASVMQAAKLETLGVSFEVLLQSADKAKQHMADLVKFSAETPFEMDGIAKTSKMLLGFGVQQKDQINILRQVGDVAAGVSVPMSELGLIYGQVLAIGKLQGTELLQLQERGIPIIKEFMKLSGKSEKQVRDLVSKGAITAKDFQIAFESMTKSGGMFNNMMAKQSQTLAGLGSTLKDEMASALADIGQFIVKEFELKKVTEELIKTVGKMRDGFKKFIKEHPILAKLVLLFLAFLAALGPILIVVGQLVIAFAALKFALGILGVTIMSITLPILAVLALVALLATAAWMVYKNWDDMVAGFKLLMGDIGDWFKGLWEAMANQVGRFTDMVNRKFEALKQKFINFKEKIKDIMFAITFGGKLNIFGSSSSDVNVTLNAPPGVIQDVQTSSKGFSPGFGLGVNMVN